MNKTVLACLIVFLTGTQVLAARNSQLYENFGLFSDATNIDPDNAECDGFSVRLWWNGNKIIGKMHQHEGSCEFTGTPIYNVAYDRRKRKLTFMAPTNTPAHIWTFYGYVLEDSLEGRFLLKNLGAHQEIQFGEGEAGNRKLSRVE